MRVLRADDPYFHYLSIYKKCWEHRNKDAGFPYCLWGFRRSHGVFRCGFQSAEPPLGTCSQFVCLSAFSFGTLLRNKNILRPVEGNAHFALRPFPAQPRQNARQLVAVGAAQICSFLAEALAPNLHVGHTGALDRTLLLQTAEVGTGEEIAAFKEVHLRPEFRQQGVQILPYQSLALIGLHGFPLLVLGQRIHFGGQVELLSLADIYQGFRPDLEDFLVGQVPGLLFSAAGGLDRPEAAVSGGIPQIAGLGVGGAKEHALAQMWCSPFSERRPVDVVLPGEKGTQRLHLGLLQPCQFADLQDPIPLELLGGGLVLGVTQVQAVRKPLSGQLSDEGALAHTLGTVEHQHGVKLAARTQNPADGGAEGLPGHRPNIGGVAGAQVVHQQRIHARNLIPFRQAFDELPDGVIGPVICHLGHGDIVVPGGESAVVGVHIADELGIIGVTPELGGMLPGHLALDLHPVQELVEHHTLEVGVVLQNEGQVVQGVLHMAGLVQLQAILPVLIRELGAGLGDAFPGKDGLDLIVPQGKVAHGLEGGQLARRGVQPHILVQLPEFVEPHQVKGV